MYSEIENVKGMRIAANPEQKRENKTMNIEFKIKNVSQCGKLAKNT